MEALSEKKCCVKHCKTRGSLDTKFFNFPSSVDVCDKWIYACGNKKLKGLKPEELQKNVLVCENHFDDSDFVSSSRDEVKFGAIPKRRG